MDDWEKEVEDVKPKAAKQSERLLDDVSDALEVKANKTHLQLDRREEKKDIEERADKKYNDGISEDVYFKEEFGYVHGAGKGKEVDKSSRDLGFLKADDTSRIDGKIARKLKQGKVEIEATIDLHGMNQNQAYDALVNLVGKCQAQGSRLILVITGKGSLSEGGVLKNALPKWLNSHELSHKILFYTTANPKHGGNGAFYVLLRR